MPIPIIAYVIGSLAGGAILGALSRQPEINRLKKQIKILQDELSKVQSILGEQIRQIAELKTRYNVIKGYHFLLRTKYEGSIKGHIISQYAFQEYVVLSKKKIQGEELEKSPKCFFNLYDKMISGENLQLHEYLYIKKYLLGKYEIQIKGLMPINPENISGLIEA